MALHVKALSPCSHVETPWAHAAVFPRQNGSSSSVENDEATGNWLLSVGTWFHTDGYARGADDRLLSRYLEVGANRLALELEGFYCVVIGDARTREVLVITDVVGSCRCYFRRMADGSAVLSNSSAILAGLENFDLDPIGCQEFIGTGTIYEDRTFYRQVKKLGAAAIYRFSREGVSDTENYWHISETADQELQGGEAALALWEALLHAATKIGRAFPNPVCDLTGGYDSRALAAALLGADVAFSVTVSGPESSQDVRISKQIAGMLGLAHTHSVLDSPIDLSDIEAAMRLTDGEYDLLEYARIYRIHRRLSARFDISLNGSFAEIARGYWWDLLWPRSGRRGGLQSTVVARRRFVVTDPYSELFAPHHRADLISHFSDAVQRANVEVATLPGTLQADNVYLRLRMQHWQGRIASSTNQLWPCLSPFMFRSVLEAMLKAAPSCRRRSLLIRMMLARFQPRLAAFPLEHGYPAAPCTLSNFYRFWPLARFYGAKVWSRVASRLGLPAHSEPGLVPPVSIWEEEKVADLLDCRRMRSGGLFDTAALTRRLKRPGEPEWGGSELHSRLLSLELILETLAQAGSEQKKG